MKKLINATDTFRELICIYLGIVLLCAVAYSFAEGKSFIDALWWAFVTAMTVGYGDMYPLTYAGKCVAIILMHIVPLFIIPLIVVRLLDKVVEDKNQFTTDEQEEIKKSLSQIKSALKI